MLISYKNLLQNDLVTKIQNSFGVHIWDNGALNTKKFAGNVTWTDTFKKCNNKLDWQKLSHWLNILCWVHDAKDKIITLHVSECAWVVSWDNIYSSCIIIPLFKMLVIRTNIIVSNQIKITNHLENRILNM